MAEIVKTLLEDLGLYAAAPTTFPELIVWIVTFTVAASLLAGALKTSFVVCREIADIMERMNRK